MEALKLSLGIISVRAAPLKDDLLNYLLEMVNLHLSRKVKTRTKFGGDKASLKVVGGNSADSLVCQYSQFRGCATASGDAPEFPSVIVSRILW